MTGVVIKDPKILGGEPVFRGTRVPFKALTDHLEGGDTLDEFLEQYPGVRRELGVAAIEEARLGLGGQVEWEFWSTSGPQSEERFLPSGWNDVLGSRAKG